jgi:hypothetical protein
VTYLEVDDKLQAALGQPFSRSAWSERYLLGELARDSHKMMRKYHAAFTQGKDVALDKIGSFNTQRAFPVTEMASWMNAKLISGHTTSIHPQA